VELMILVAALLGGAAFGAYALTPKK